MPHFATYLCALTSHVVKRRLRDGSGLTLVLALGARSLLYVLLASIASVAGFRADLLLTAAAAGVSPEIAVQRHFLHALVILLVAMLLSPGPIRLDLASYRYLPIPRLTIASIGIVIGMARLPLLLFAALAIGLCSGEAVPTGGFWATARWLLVVLGSGAAVTVLATAWRRDLVVKPVRVYLPVGLLAAVVAVDHAAGTALAERGSAALIAAAVDGARWPLALLVGAFLAVLTTAVRTAVGDLRYLDSSLSRRRGDHRTAKFVEHQWAGYLNTISDNRPVILLALLELSMLRRCTYPRYQFRGIALLLCMLLVFSALAPDDPNLLVTTLLVVAGLSATYTQLVFAWNSDHFEALFALPLEAVDHVRARWLVSALLAGASSTAMCLFLLVLGRTYLLEVGSVLVVTTGCVNAPLMLLSILYARPVDLEGNGMANLKAYSWHFYLVILALWMGTQLLVSLSSATEVATIYLAVGILGLILQPSAIRYLGAELNARLPEIAERLRTSA